MSYQKILAAIDLCAGESPIFTKALTLAQQNQAQLVLLHCSPLPPVYSSNYINFLNSPADWTMDLSLAEESQRQDAELARQHLKELRQQALDVNVDAIPLLRFIDPNRGICDAVKDLGVDLVVLGRRGLQGISELLMGSVSSYVVHHVSCDVLIVQTGQ